MKREKIITSENDALKLRMLKVKSKIPFDYTSLYQYEYGLLDQHQIDKVRNVWNLKTADELIVSRFEKMAENLKNR